MPLYEYQCEACGHRFERIQKFSDPHADVCPKCGERKLHKLVSSPAIQFKGSGWYVNDYAKKSTPAGDPSTTVAPTAKGDDKSSSEKGSSDKSSSDKNSSEKLSSDKSSSDKGSSEKGSSEKSASAPAAGAKD